jgi:Helix-turn-helix of DDE superfamily endonuclease
VEPAAGDRVLLVAEYWRTNLTLRQLAPLSGVSKSAADRIIDHLRPGLALQERKRFCKDTVLTVGGTHVPTRDHRVAEQSKNYRYSTNHQVVTDADPSLPAFPPASANAPPSAPKRANR